MVGCGLCVDWDFGWEVHENIFIVSFFFNVEFGCSVDKSCYYSSVSTFFPVFSHILPQLYQRGWKDNCVSGQGAGRSCEPSLQHQKNVLNSNDAASTSACDSESSDWGGEQSEAGNG